MKKSLIVIYCCLWHSLTFAQKTFIEEDWVRVLETDYETEVSLNPKMIEADYLKLSMKSDGTMKLYSNYTSHGIQVSFDFIGGNLIYGPSRVFKIEQYNADRLVMVETFDGKVSSDSKRHYYLPEKVYLDKLPIPYKDLVVVGKDTAYLASKKLYPIFQTTNTPDFHIFIHNQVRSAYLTGENYVQATFMIRPDGSIDHININHHVSKGSDKRVVKAIMASAGRWQMPQLNGTDVNIIMTIEDFFKKRSESTSSTPSKIDLNYSPEDPVTYMGYFNLAVRKTLTEQPQKALEYLQLCEDLKPKNPSLAYLRYLLFNNSSQKEQANQQLALVKKSRLKYLLK